MRKSAECGEQGNEIKPVPEKLRGYDWVSSRPIIEDFSDAFGEDPLPQNPFNYTMK